VTEAGGPSSGGPSTGGRVAVVVVAALVLVGLVLVGTRARTVAGFAVVDGRVEQVAVTCGSLLAGGGVEDVGGPTGVEVPQDEGLEVDPGVSCPEDGAVWQVGIGMAAVLVVGAAAWAWQLLGAGTGPTAGAVGGARPGSVMGSIDRAAEHVAETSRTRRAGSGRSKAARGASGRRRRRSS
jgi:hypothetical protein